MKPLEPIVSLWLASPLIQSYQAIILLCIWVKPIRLSDLFSAGEGLPTKCNPTSSADGRTRQKKTPNRKVQVRFVFLMTYSELYFHINKVPTIGWKNDNFSSRDLSFKFVFVESLFSEVAADYELKMRSNHRVHTNDRNTSHHLTVSFLSLFARFMPSPHIEFPRSLCQVHLLSSQVTIFLLLTEFIFVLC